MAGIRRGTAQTPVKNGPRFTRAELKAIHFHMYRIAWQGEWHYEGRATAMRKLDDFFAQEREHLKGETR